MSVYQPYWVSDKIFDMIEADPLNANSNRNIRNTSKSSYNCGGYALECFSWYCPKGFNDFDFGFDDWDEAMQKTRDCVDVMLADFPDLRIVHTLDEVQDNEYAILFRLSSDGDFHYLKRDRGNHWHHKIGDSRHIETIKTANIFGVWNFRYDGPIVILAKRRGR